jgi:hypothetical protein
MDGEVGVFDIELTQAPCYPAWDLGGEVIELNLQVASVSTFNEIVRDPCRFLGRRD